MLDGHPSFSQAGLPCATYQVAQQHLWQRFTLHNSSWWLLLRLLHFSSTPALLSKNVARDAWSVVYADGGEKLHHLLWPAQPPDCTAGVLKQLGLSKRVVSG